MKASKKVMLWVILMLLPLSSSGVVITMEEVNACQQDSSEDTNCLVQTIKNKDGNKDGIWLTGKVKSPDTGRILYSASTYNQPDDSEENIQLMALCDDSKPVFFINWNQRIAPFGETYKVTYKIDNEAAQSAEAIILTGDSTQFLDPVSLMKEVVAAKTFTAGVVNLEGKTVTALFDTKEAGQAFASLRQSCNW